MYMEIIHELLVEKHGIHGITVLSEIFRAKVGMGSIGTTKTNLQAEWETVWILISWLLRSQLICILTVFRTSEQGHRTGPVTVIQDPYDDSPNAHRNGAVKQSRT